MTITPEVPGGGLFVAPFAEKHQGEVHAQARPGLFRSPVATSPFAAGELTGEMD